MIKKYSALAITASLIINSSCASVHSTIDSFGDSSIQRNSWLHFVEDDLPLEAKQIASLCKAAAIDAQLKVSTTPCTDCIFVRVSGQLGGSSTHVGSYATNQTVYTPKGTVSVPVAKTYSETLHDRTIHLSLYSNKKMEKEVRTITARSSGGTNSLAGVTRQMCLAIFEDFPANINGKEYALDMDQ